MSQAEATRHVFYGTVTANLHIKDAVGYVA
jgi:hypothetical protein